MRWWKAYGVQSWWRDFESPSRDTWPTWQCGRMAPGREARESPSTPVASRNADWEDGGGSAKHSARIAAVAVNRNLVCSLKAFNLLSWKFRTPPYAFSGMDYPTAAVNPIKREHGGEPHRASQQCPNVFQLYVRHVRQGCSGKVASRPPTRVSSWLSVAVILAARNAGGQAVRADECFLRLEWNRLNLGSSTARSSNRTPYKRSDIAARKDRQGNSAKKRRREAS
ncbi:unnamed protein product [Phytophthora lilii]|uniref:Unnamed protein product n=1 Tax=Phytophthora lilii TaxID=2077276 RepID=A0A9W6TU55_9STRA|nr:unnamed protein product [Phytophthora lilii]